MSQQEFIEKFRHEIDGWVLDAAMSGRSGENLSLWLKVIRSKIEAKLGAMYDELSKAGAVNTRQVRPAAVDGPPLRKSS